MKPTDPTADDTVTTILAAMVRVLAGHPTIATPGDITITAVVAEAQVKRHLLTHKHTELKDLFYHLRDACNNPLIARAEKATAEHADLKKKLADARHDAREWKATAHVFARAIHALTIENAELKTPRRSTPLRPVP
ncbi:hypothetical protein [Mycolicibacterium mucogenicum]|uniref:hypothetical protein n=1 Tax=Mycolicibacterium mucogenicum TaxID=56689 RepID=UPI0009F6E0B5|nr:hypothetical protein [Mycolicibacterium mucogenicum]